MSGRDEEPDPDEPVSIPVTGELDLHSFAPRDVESVVRDYVEACRERGILTLRLVHGRGRGVQRAAVQRLLRSLDFVANVRDAPPASGGWGATLAEISPRRDEER